MKAFITSRSAVTPCPLSPQGFPSGNPDLNEQGYFKCIEPEYRLIINPALIRRMSRVVRMGVAAALQSLKDAGIEKPDAILTGTGLGCIEDTENFLNSMRENNEQFLTPTPFIQSTHNTIGAQIALLTKCKGYNFAYVHRTFSFESALLDSIMQISQESCNYVLTGGVDELTDVSFSLMKKLGMWNNYGIRNPQIAGNAAVAGEGSVFFVLSGSPDKAITSVYAPRMIFMPEKHEEVSAAIISYLNDCGCACGDIDLLITGANADSRFDHVYETVRNGLFPAASVATYKNLCGEYFTSSAFAMWLAASVLETNRIPEVCLTLDARRPDFRRILIYNQHFNRNHSLILLEKC